MNSVLLRKLRVAITPRNWLLRARLANGVTVAGYNRPGWGGRGVYIYRDKLEPELAILDRFLKPGFVFVDVGANVGVFTLKAAKEVGESGLVIAIEPFIESAVQLSRNITNNRLFNCRVRNLCLSRTTSHGQLYLNNMQPNSFSLTKDSHGTMSLSVLCVSLTDLCKWEAIDRLDYLKIDAEGAEDMILEGGVEIIERFRPIIQVEIIKTSSSLPSGYRRFSSSVGINNLLIPSERDEAIEAAMAAGWTDIA